jgi:hypothetical protein
MRSDVTGVTRIAVIARDRRDRRNRVHRIIGWCENPASGQCQSPSKATVGNKNP